MKLEVAEERRKLGIIICPFYGPRPIVIRPMPVTTLSAYASLIPRPARARRLQQ